MKNIINRILFLTMLFLISLVINKINKDTFFSKTYLQNVFSKNINFLKISDLYTGIFNQFSSIDKTEQSSFSLIEVLKKEKYKNGIYLFTNQEVVYSFEDGVVINKGKSKELGNFVVVQSINNREITYGNLLTVDVKIYEFVKKDDIIGSSIKEEEGYCFYVAMKKEEYLDVISMFQ